MKLGYLLVNEDKSLWNMWDLAIFIIILWFGLHLLTESPTDICGDGVVVLVVVFVDVMKTFINPLLALLPMVVVVVLAAMVKALTTKTLPIKRKNKTHANKT